MLFRSAERLMAFRTRDLTSRLSKSTMMMHVGQVLLISIILGSLLGFLFLFAVFLIPIGKEEPQSENAPSCLGIFLVGHTRDGGDVETGVVGDVFENHWSQVGFVAVLEEFPLPTNDSFHGGLQGMLALLDSIYQSFGNFQVFAQYGECLTVTFRHVFGVVEDVDVCFREIFSGARPDQRGDPPGDPEI